MKNRDNWVEALYAIGRGAIAVALLVFWWMLVSGGFGWVS